MKADASLDYFEFQLSPKRSRFELHASSRGNTEKLVSGLLKPFVTHLKVVEDQIANSVQFIRLDVGKRRNEETWFTKGTLERFVRFVSTPEVLELVGTFDAEMSQLETASKIYSQGTGDQMSGMLGADGSKTTTEADATKKELSRAIDLRLGALRQDLITACARAASAGFSPGTVLELRHFADEFGARRLNEACTKFLSLCQRRPDLVAPWKPGVDDHVVRSSWGSDMSIDDPTDDVSLSHDKHPHQIIQRQEQKPSTAENHLLRSQSSSAIFQQRTLQDFTQNEKNNEMEKEEPKTDLPRGQSSQTGRRLSVQDRINLFENKQKEITSGSGGKSISMTKSTEQLRRLPSDVSSSSTSVEKAVFRRWSTASDMSIDVGNGKKENSFKTDIPSCTTPCSSVTDTKSTGLILSSDDGKNDQTELTVSAGSIIHSSGLNNQGDLPNQIGRILASEVVESEEKSNLKEQVVSWTQLRGLKGDAGEGGVIDQWAKEEKPQDSWVAEGIIGNVASDGESANKLKEARPRAQPVGQLHHMGLQSHTSSRSGNSESMGIKNREVQCKETNSQQQGIPLLRETKEVIKKSTDSVTKKATQMEDSSVSRVNSTQMYSADVEPNSKLLDVCGNEESYGTNAKPPVERVQRVRQPKRNKELDDELKTKANELEKLFAEHKLRGGDNSTVTRRSKPADMHIQHVVSSNKRKPAEVSEATPVQFPERNALDEQVVSSNVVDEFSYQTPAKMIDLRKNFSELNLSNDSRGKSYEKYTQRRDAKLREEWGVKREEKDAKMKAMHDSFEKSKAEMKTKFAANRQDSVSNARRRAEKLRSFNYRSSMSKEQPQVDFNPTEEDEDLAQNSEHKFFGQTRSFRETTLGDSASKISQHKKSLPNRHSSPTTAPRPTATLVSRSSGKISSINSGRRKAQSENPLAQSVPNFSDFRKENTKPFHGISKAAIRSQPRSYIRSRSTATEEVPLIKEEKSHRSQSLRKSAVGLVEYKEFPSLSSDKGIGSVTGTSAAKRKALVPSETFEDCEESLSEIADSLDMGKEEEEEAEAADEDSPEMENGKQISREDSVKQNLSESENDDFQLIRQDGPSSVADLPSIPASTLSRFLHESPEESPSWNDRMNHPFSYPHETSDFDASVDSPIGSPASWNSHSLTQTEADVARMRKKWGSTQKPFLVAHNQSRKDVASGFKRLLKFGRKSRGTESLVDWVSVTTSEGDDDTEDGRDPANRSSEDLRKSRMGFFRGHPSEDGSNESDLFNEQVHALNSSIPAPPANFKMREDHMSGSSMKAPRSFFSLSTFRSKGSDSKLR